MSGKVITTHEQALGFFEAAKSALEKATRIDEVKRLRDQAEAVRAYVRQSQGSLVMQNQCAEIKLRAERRLGEMLEETPLHEGGRPKNRSHDGTGLPTLEELGVNKNQSSRWQHIADIPERDFDRYIKTVKEANDGEELTTAGLLRAAERQNVVSAMSSSETYEWYTPARYVDAAREVLGDIDLDPASSAKANETVRARRFFTLADDGLKRRWTGRVFLNPPYGLSDDGRSNQGVWSDAIIERHRGGSVKEAVLLVNAATDSSWFQVLWDFPLCFVAHRIQFCGPEGKGSQPTHGNVFAYFGRRVDGFARRFAEFGRIVVPDGSRSVVLKRR